MSEFVAWLWEELSARQWNHSELGRQAGVSHATVSTVMNGQQRPTVVFCRGVAEALNLPVEAVLRQAGLLPPLQEREAKIEEILYYYDRMTPEMQEGFRRIARALGEGKR